jgi:hypothetical protein
MFNRQISTSGLPSRTTRRAGHLSRRNPVARNPVTDGTSSVHVVKVWANVPSDHRNDAEHVHFKLVAQLIQRKVPKRAKCRLYRHVEARRPHVIRRVREPSYQRRTC